MISKFFFKYNLFYFKNKTIKSLTKFGFFLLNLLLELIIYANLLRDLKVFFLIINKVFLGLLFFLYFTTQTLK